MSQITLNALVGYFYGNIGNVLKNAVNGQATIFTFDAANQLVSSTCDGVTTRYAYDAAGRLVKEGSKTYTYGYLDKVLSVTDGDTKRTFTYHADGQLASASCDGIGRAGAHASSDIASQCSLRSGDMRTPQTETFLRDGLALIQRGDEQFVNEPHVGGGNPVASSKKATYFNDLLGTTVGQKTGNTYTAAALTAFGEPLPNAQPSTPNAQPFFTGKPQVEGLGYAFLMRNYRAGLAKWQTADPMGYPDGWNALAYCGNGVTSAVDLWGCVGCPGGECEFIWHEYRDEIYFDCSDCVFPSNHPHVPSSTDVAKSEIKKLKGLNARFGDETSLYRLSWEFIKTYGECTIGNYEYRKEHFHQYQITETDYYAYCEKTNLLESIGDSCTTIGAAIALATILFPEIAIPAWVGNTTSIGGFLAWLGTEIPSDDCKILLFTEYEGKWLEDGKVELWHRRIE